jgi:pimeloyl-ACP methyl ester carboxylesterase
LIYNAAAQNEKSIMNSRNLFLNGRKVSYLQFGKGKPVFLLHGWGGSKESWLSLVRALEFHELSNEFCFIAVDFPGFGESEEPEVAWDVSDYSRWFLDFVDYIYRENEFVVDFDLIVHSFGGRVLFKLISMGGFTKNHPDRLVLIAAAGIKPTPTKRMRLASLAARSGKKILSIPGLRWSAPLAQKLLYKALKSHDYEKSSGVMRDTLIKVLDEDLEGEVRAITRPTLIIWGDKDSYVPVSDGKQMEQNIAGSIMKVIKNGRHGIHKTHAREIAVWIKDFLTNR